MAKNLRKSKKPTLMQQFMKEWRRIWKGLLAAKRRGYMIDYNPLPDIPKRVRREQLAKIKQKKPKDYLKEFDRLVPDTGEIIKAKEPKQKKREKAIAAGKEMQIDLESVRARHEREKGMKQAQASNLPPEPENVSRETSEPENVSRETLEAETSTPEPEQKKTAGQKLRDGEYEGLGNIGSVDWGEVYVSGFLSQFDNYRPAVREMVEQWINALVTKYGDGPVGQMIAEAAREGGLDFNSSWAYDAQAMHGYLSDIITFMEDAGEITASDFMDAFEEDETWEDFVNG